MNLVLVSFGQKTLAFYNKFVMLEVWGGSITFVQMVLNPRIMIV